MIERRSRAVAVRRVGAGVTWLAAGVLLFASVSANAQAGGIKALFHWLDESAQAARTAARLAPVTEQVATIRGLVDEGDYDGARQAARDPALEIDDVMRLRLVRLADRWIRQHRFVNDFVAAFERRDLVVAERLLLEYRSQEWPPSVLARRAAEIVADGWADWRQHLDGLAGDVPVSPGLAAEDVRALKSIESVTAIRRVQFVSGNVARFADRFRAGARAPREALQIAEQIDAALVQAWRSTPRDRRIFLAGSSADAALVARLRTQLQADGYAVFFYKYCMDVHGELCPSEVVGAFFETSGRALLVDTPDAALSRYVQVEVGVARDLRSAEEALILITPSDVASAGAGVVFVALAGAAGE